ncbi:MAG: histone deacetylase family protein [Pseudomonadota bacterium]
MTTALINHPAGLEHVTPPGHPEQVARLEYIMNALKDHDGLLRIKAPMGSEADIMRCHPSSYITDLRSAAPNVGFRQLDADTHMSPGTIEAAFRAVGGMTRAVDEVISGNAKNAFVAMRPPGHHAETSTPMGFCLFGNVAIGAKYALEHHGLKRVAVVDFDVHHGNGTQDLLWNEPRALLITSQQMPLWPGTGERSDKGGHNNIVNLPIAPGGTGAEMRALYQAEVFPRLRAFNPDMLFISAGFDAHQDDPLANLNWSTDDFRWLTQELCKIAQETSQGRVVSALEGGYDLDALAASVAAHVTALQEAAA